MNIGIITFHGALNFGSALQAYALRTALVNEGHKVRIINYRALDYEQYSLIQVRHPRKLLRTLTHWKSFHSRWSAFNSFANDYFSLTDKAYSSNEEGALAELAAEFDCFICGSDQIWNLDCTRGVVEPSFSLLREINGVSPMLLASPTRLSSPRISIKKKLRLFCPNSIIFPFVRRKRFLYFSR